MGNREWLQVKDLLIVNKWLILFQKEVCWQSLGIDIWGILLSDLFLLFFWIDILGKQRSGWLWFLISIRVLLLQTLLQKTKWISLIQIALRVNYGCLLHKYLIDVFNVHTLLIIPIALIVYSVACFQLVILLNAYFSHIKHIIKQNQIIGYILKCVGIWNYNILPLYFIAIDLKINLLIVFKG